MLFGYSNKKIFLKFSFIDIALIYSKSLFIEKLIK